MKSRQHILMILDGVGLSDKTDGNAFALANTPNLDRLMKVFPTSRLAASGFAVGLPDGQMGNSEVGHANIGAGRTIYQDFTRISKDISDGTFYENEAFIGAIENAKKHNSALHLMGLVSDGGVHSHQEHLYSLLELAKKHGLERVYVHAFLDGRDTMPGSAVQYIEALENKITEIGVGKIASLSGRYYAMDRDNRYDRTELAYNAMVCGEGARSSSASLAIQESLKNEITDEFFAPTVIEENGVPVGKISDNDSVIFFNFRLDRARQITKSLVDADYSGFTRKIVPSGLFFVAMTEYDAAIKNIEVAYRPQDISNTFGQYISGLGYSQIRMAETEKYAHVTFYFNGGEEQKYLNEDRVMIQSPSVATYDLKPEMSAMELTTSVIEIIKSKKHDMIVVNFANGDMVGHTGKIDKAIEAMQAVDECVGMIIDELNIVGGEGLIIADHGNCEYMLDDDKNIITSHSVFDVPCIVISDRISSVDDGKLCDVAPTMLTLMGELIPEEMTGRNLVKFK